MKRLILMGERPWLAEDGGESFAHTLFRYFSHEVKLAFCIFAQPVNDRSATHGRNEEMFNLFKDKRKIAYKTMTPENFTDVSKWADVIYIPGGNPYILHDQIVKSGDTSKLWDGKIIAGSSAGADLFCANYIYLQDKTFNHGLDWVNVTCIPHWRNDFENRYTDLDWDLAEKEALLRYPKTPVSSIMYTRR